MTVALLAAQIAESDCETFHSGLLDQPVNAWTSLAMVVAGLLIAYDVKRRHLTSQALVFAAAIAFAGVGSVIFHGFPSAGGRWVHDVSLLMVLGIMAGVHVGRALRNQPVPALWSAAVTLVAAGVLLAFVPDATDVLVAVLVAAIVLAEIISRRRGQPPLIGFWIILFTALGVASFLLGRTDAPLCDPDSEVQLHGLWHMLIAVIAMLWADRAFAAPEPRRAGWGRAAISRFVVALARSATRALLRDVEVVGRERLPDDRPVLIVSNHFNGFVDPVLVIAGLGRLPRFLAKGTLWNIAPAGAALDTIGVLPVHRAEDREGLDNASTFAAAHDSFLVGDSVALFPEGTTGDRAQLDRVRTGAARIALGAVENGVTGLSIVAVGLAYEDRLGWRSRVMVEVGEPLELDSDVPALVPETSELSESDHDAVNALTNEVDARLRAVSPNYEDVTERETLRLAANIALRDGPSDPPFAAIESKARSLARASLELREEIHGALASYLLNLRIAGLTDRDVAELTPRGPILRAVLTGVLLVVTIPLMIVGVLANFVPFLAVRWASRRAEAVVTKGTVRLVVGLIAFPLTWLVLGFLATGTTLGTLAVAVLLALAGLLTILLAEKAREATGDLLAAVRSSDRRSLLDQLAAERSALIALVDE